MKQITLINTNGQYDRLLDYDLYYAYCRATSTEQIEAERHKANLIIVCPNDDKRQEWWYFFDLRDTVNDDTRK